MITTDVTPVGIKAHDINDTYYLKHPDSDSCNVADYVIKVGYRA